jgi:HPr kinase/phosphorylase
VRRELVHATAVAIEGHGILLTGPSGSGKSDLALRLIDRGGVLISDDVVIISRTETGLSVGVAPNIEGKIEIRGLGIFSVQHLSSAPLRLVVGLSNEIERMPDEDRTEKILGVEVPSIELAPFEGSAPVKVEMALSRVVDAMAVSVSGDSSARAKAKKHDQ